MDIKTLLSKIKRNKQIAIPVICAVLAFGMTSCCCCGGLFIGSGTESETKTETETIIETEADTEETTELITTEIITTEASTKISTEETTEETTEELIASLIKATDETDEEIPQETIDRGLVETAAPVEATVPVPAETEAPIITQAPSSSTIVYITETGEKYHRSNCRHLKYSKIETTLENAIASGYGPCGTCKPPTE